jgi:hypothetical protein
MNLHRRNKAAKVMRGRASVLAGLTLACLCAAGCKTTPGGKNEDPLFGLRPPQVAPVPPANASALPGSPPPQASWNSVPPLPTATSADSTAALASLPGARPLRINETQPKTSGTPTVQPIPRDAADSNPALLTTGWTQSTPAVNASIAAPQPQPQLSAEQALSQLKARGALAEKVEPAADGQFTVTALVAMPAGQVRHFEAKRATVPEAVRAILQQIEQ